MAKHTPAPWWVTDHGIRDVGGYIAHTNPVQRYEGQDERYAFEVAQREADKLLIAEAPNLLFQLLAAANYIDTLGGDSKSYRAAIAKATQPKDQP